MQPLVSVRVITYNHEKYIAQCIEGILMQKTDFPFEIIIGEDCSTDDTRKIVLEYGEKYPEKIRVIISEKNVGAVQNTLRVGDACRGKYQAYCEGDDYWIDPLKLQKQVDLMESDPDMSLSFHNAFIINEFSFVSGLFFSPGMPATLDFAQACKINMPLGSALIRSDVIRSAPEWRTQVWCPDVILRLWSAHQGKLGYVDEIMSVRRTLMSGMAVTMYAQREKRRQDDIFLYQELDKDTDYKHTEALQLKLEEIEEKYRRLRQGNFYYFLHPGALLSKLKEYRDLRNQRLKMWQG